MAYSYSRHIDLDVLGEMEVEVAPLRVIRGGRTRTPEDWRTFDPGRHPSSFASLAEFNEAGGITIVVWGSMSPSVGYRPVEYPRELMRDEQVTELFDVMNVEQSLFQEVELFGTAIGEIDERCLVLYLSSPTSLRFDQVKSVLELTVNEEFIAATAERRAQRNIEMFVRGVQRQDVGLVNNLRAEIHESQDMIVRNQRAIENSRNTLREKAEELDLVIARREQDFDEEKALAEWQALERHTKVERIEFSSSDRLTVFTHELEVTHPDLEEPVEVGKFAIKLQLTVPSITVHNLTNRRGDFDHPHVRNGSFCMGEVEPTLHRLLREYQVSAAVNLAIRSLGHVVPEDDYGRHIHWWTGAEDAPEPTVRDEE